MVQMQHFFIRGSHSMIPMQERSCIPMEDENNKVGTIAIPTLFICGVNDIFLLCNNSYTTNVPVELIPNYEHVNYQCGHDFFLQGSCVDMAESQAVMDKITAFVFNLTGGVSNTTIGSNNNDTATEETSSSSANLNLTRTLPLVLLVFGGAIMAGL
jgi:hypothetical protein